ncbi:MAG: hypothetical protein P4L84_36105 [Isosphaeraceae bacterium]|nr:hypothetical protein [Isosphaeraceae bacterium]
MLDLALAAHATRELLGGDAAAPFGFRVTPLGVSPCLCNVGPLGAPFQAANGSSLTVLHILNVVNAQTVGGVPLAGNDALRQQAHDVLDLVNRFGERWHCRAGPTSSEADKDITPSPLVGEGRGGG